MNSRPYRYQRYALQLSYTGITWLAVRFHLSPLLHGAVAFPADCPVDSGVSHCRGRSHILATGWVSDWSRHSELNPVIEGTGLAHHPQCFVGKLAPQIRLERIFRLYKALCAVNSCEQIAISAAEE